MVASRFLENLCTPDLTDSTAYVVQGTTVNQFKIDPLLCKQKRDYKIYKKVIIKIILIKVSQ